MRLIIEDRCRIKGKTKRILGRCRFNRFHDGNLVNN